MTTGRERRQKAREERQEPTISQTDFLTPREQQKEERPEPTAPQTEFLTPRERRALQRQAAQAAKESGGAAGAPVPDATPEVRPTLRGPRGGGVAAIARRELVQLQQASAQKEDSKLLRKTSAVKIQRAWRAYVKHKRNKVSQKKQDHAAAIIVQSRFRAHAVRFATKRRAAVSIQKWARGFLVRLVRKRNDAALVVQRHARGLQIRKQAKMEHENAAVIQRRFRQHESKASAKALRDRKKAAAKLIQSGARRWVAMALVERLRAERDEELAVSTASTRIQSAFRGKKGRKKAEVRFAEDKFAKREAEAATKLQASVRQRQAERRVGGLRTSRQEEWHRAATVIQKNWLRHIYRKRYQELRREFRLHEGSVVVLQRYVRGFIVRSRMWRDAIRAEEELWASVEIQRCWRGYQGRVKWELEYEAVWSRETAAIRLQRAMRGWLSRTRVLRMRKRAARAEFEKARRRFKAAQKLQALVRGVQTRKRIAAYHRRKTAAATNIQRVHRGHRQRCVLWEQVMAKRTTQIQALARGFLVRQRRSRLIAKMIMIQRAWRRYLNAVPAAERESRVERVRARREKARQDAAGQANSI
jgi:hypothetical protein